MPTNEQRSGANQEQYSHGYGAPTDLFAQRTVSNDAGFFIRYLRSGMNLLDCGCGPGTITVDLAEVVSPGETVGIDIGPSQIERAGNYAKEKGVSNIRFEVADIYELPFSDASFDAVFAHTVLQHLNSPADALKEIHRVLKPGGVVGLREEEQGNFVITPYLPMIQESMELYLKDWQNTGGDPAFARHHRKVLREAGFIEINATASVLCFGNSEETRNFGDIRAREWLEQSYVDRVIASGLSDHDSLEKMSSAWREWGDHPDAYAAVIFCEAVGRKE